MSIRNGTLSDHTNRPGVPIAQLLGSLTLVGIILASLIAISRANYLLFHSLAELIGVAVAWSVFMLAWNARKHMQNDVVLILGIAHLFVGIIDLAHTLAYSGMNVFPNYGMNLSLQFWIAARYVQSLSTLAAVVLGTRAGGLQLSDRQSRARIAIVGYAVATALLIWCIFARVFPTCYIEGAGFTPFKRISESLLSLLLVLAGILLWRRGAHLDRQVRTLLLTSIAATAAAEIALTFYTGSHGISTTIGHTFKVIAGLALYQAVVHTGISQPYTFLSEELQASEARLKSIFRVAPAGIGMIKDRVLMEANDRIFRMTGYSQNELLGVNVRLLYPTQSDYDYVGYEKRRQIDATGACALESRWQRKDGTIIDVLMASTPLNPEDLIQGEIFTVLDITQRQRLVAEVREQARRLQAIMDTVPEGVLLLQADGRILTTDSAAERGLAELGEVLPDGRLASLGNRPLAELLAAPPEGFWHEFKVGTRTFEALSHPIESDLHPERYVLVCREVTRERAVAAELRQQERLAAVGQLAAGVAHDFNNILAVIVLYAQMSLQMPDLPASLRERNEVIVSEAKRGADLVQQILDFSRRAMLERRLTDLTALLGEHVAVLRRTLPESIRIDLQAPAEGVFVNADSNRLKQLVTNLAVNARDAMLAGGVLAIRVEFVNVVPGALPPLPGMLPGPWAKLVVSDTGTGFSTQAKAHLFEPFFTTKQPGKGSGLGLPQVYGIVKQHEGHITVESEAGRGAVFTIYLPALEAVPQAPETTTSGPLAMGHGETIMVVEDNPALRQAMVDSLGQLGYQAAEATNGREALLLLERHAADFAAVLSDMVMPVMGGQALLQTLEQRGIHIPFLMVTGHPLDQAMQGIQQQGLVTWLHKPLRLEQLADALCLALALREG